MNAPKPALVIPNHTRRDALIAGIIGVIVLAFLGYGVFKMAQPEKGNQLTGIVVGKEFTPQKERQISFNGHKVEGVKETDGDYILKVRVDSENRTYEVPVEKEMYEQKKAGDPLTFIRPPSEQR